MNNYTYRWWLKDKGFVQADNDEYNTSMQEKKEYVKMYLSPSVHYANCGWDHCKYFLMKGCLGYEEYVVLYPDRDDKGGRWYNVSGNSLGAIAETIWANVFR